MKKTCKRCGDKYTPDADEMPNTTICQECFDMEEYGQNNQDYEPYSDADPGL